jgi:hypothetical protein
MRDKPSRLRVALLLGALTALVAAYASLVFTETAAIKVAVPPQRLEANIALNTTAAGNLQIQHLDVAVTETAQGTASSVTIASAYAVGEVTFRFSCGWQQPCNPVQVHSGTVVATITGRYVRFATQATVTVLPVQPGAYHETTVGIRALAIGAGGNVTYGIIDVIENPSPGLQVFNRHPTTGGVTGRVAQIVEQSDMDAVQAALAAKARSKLDSAMSAKAAGMTYLVEGPPVMAFTSDRAVGDEAPTFTVTLATKQGARAFSNSAAQAILRPALQPLVWPGYELSNSIQAEYQMQAGTGTNLVITAHAVGFAVPSLSSRTERDRLKGLSTSDAYASLRHDYPGSAVDISTKPLALPWLPLITDHINLTMVVQPAV